MGILLQISYEGLSGEVAFNADGDRVNYTIDVYMGKDKHNILKVTARSSKLTKKMTSDETATSPSAFVSCFGHRSNTKMKTKNSIKSKL